MLRTILEYLHKVGYTDQYRKSEWFLIVRVIIAFFVILLLPYCHSGKSDIILPALDRQSLYPVLFNAEEQNGWCIWKPSQAEKDSSNVSWDGVCHTRLDTILSFSDNKANVAVVLFGTYEFDVNGMAECHACAPLVSIAIAQQNSKGYWIIHKFIKDFGLHGSWGRQPDYGIVYFGKDVFLVEDWGFSNQGCTESGSSFYHIPSLIESIKIQGFTGENILKGGQLTEEWSDSISDASVDSTTKVTVHRKGFRTTKNQSRVFFDSMKTYVLNDSNVFR